MGTRVGHTLAAALVLLAVQWLMLATVEDWRWRLGCLAVPAVLAGATVARLWADHDVMSVRRGGGR